MQLLLVVFVVGFNAVSLNLQPHSIIDEAMSLVEVVDEGNVETVDETIANLEALKKHSVTWFDEVIAKLKSNKKFFSGLYSNMTIDCNNQFNDFSSTTAMKNAGWNLGVGEWQNNNGGVAGRCRRGTNWFGWTGGSNVGTVSIKLQGNGEATLDFGNCWNVGEVKVYVDDKEVASAPKDTPSITVSFHFRDGDILKLRDEGANSVIAINDITCRCSSGKKCYDDLPKTLNTPNKYNYITMLSGMVEKHVSSVRLSFQNNLPNNDRHIGLAQTEAHNSKKWELVLGGWGGAQSVIRSSNQGTNLVSKSHSKSDFHKWCSEIDVRFGDGYIQVWSVSSNRELIGYKNAAIKRLDMKYFMVSTGWGANGDWTITEVSCK